MAKTKKIEVLFGSRLNKLGGDFSFDWVEETKFEADAVQIFEYICDFKNNGGNLREITGRFRGVTDTKSYEMNFYCEEDDLTTMLKEIKDIFGKIKPKGVDYVSIKVYNVDSYSFKVGE